MHSIIVKGVFLAFLLISYFVNGQTESLVFNIERKIGSVKLPPRSEGPKPHFVYASLIKFQGFLAGLKRSSTDVSVNVNNADMNFQYSTNLYLGSLD